MQACSFEFFGKSKSASWLRFSIYRLDRSERAPTLKFCIFVFILVSWC
jgi:hypothetical protein